MNNYEKQREDWRQQFLTMDQEDICKRLPEVCRSDTHLILWHYGRQFTVDRESGEISALSDDKPVDMMPQLNIYTLADAAELPIQRNVFYRF